MMNCLFSSFLISATLMMSCMDQQSKNISTEQVITGNKTLQPIKMAADLGIQPEYLQLIIDECDQMDLTFNDRPITMNQREKSAIISDLSYISPTYYDEIPGSCSPMARKVYYGKDGVLMEADVYFSNECLYFVFIRDEKPLFANAINDVGIKFYNDLLAKINSMNQ